MLLILNKSVDKSCCVNDSHKSTYFVWN